MTLSKLKAGQAPGPDAVPNEVWLLLDHTALETLLDIYNRADDRRNA